MDVGDCRTVHRLPSSISRRFAERRPGSIGHITLRGKCAGARSAGKPHAACDVAGAGNGLTVRLVRHSHRKRGETDRPRLRSTAPALDPTEDEFAATKKRALDDFVRSYRYRRRDASATKRRASRLAKRVKDVLDAMAATFEDQDQLLTSIGLITREVKILMRLPDGKMTG